MWAVPGGLSGEPQHPASKENPPLSNASASAQLIYRSNIASIRAVGQIEASTAPTRLDATNHAISQDDATIAKYEQAFTADLQAVDAAFAAYRASNPAGDPDLIADVENNWRAYTEVARTRLLPAGRANDMAGWQRAATPKPGRSSRS